MKTNKLFHIFIIFLVLLQSLVYPWISILPAPPGVQAAESPPEEATLAASTPAPSPLEPNSLDQILNQILSTSTQSAQTPRPEAIPEATISALPEAIPETPTSTPSATLEPQSSPSTLPLDLPSVSSSQADVISSTPSPVPTNTPSPVQKTATSLTANTSQLAPLLDPFDINLSYPFIGTYPISYSFGEHSHNDYISGMQSLFGVNAHDGIDFAMPVGTPILATADGNIISSGTGLYGTTIQIEHTWGISYYGHLSDLAIGEGESVTAGQIIGYSGMSGITTGPHLHFGIRPLSPNLLNGYHGLIDPYPYFGSTKYSHILGVKNGKSIRFNPRIRQIKNKFTFPKKSLKNDESLIQLDFAKAESKDLSIILRNPKGVETNLTHVVENLNGPLGGVLTLDLNESLDLVPGRYELTITDADGNYDTQDFTWGVLAINTNKTIYLPASAVDFSMAVLDNQGDMVCDANINLEITSPTGVVTKLSSQSGEVTVNLVTCLSKNYTLTPDYQTSFVPKEIGDYLVKMSATTADGTRSIDSNFRVQNSVPFDVERVTITRIYPRLDYPVILRIHAFEDYVGSVEDVIPTNFELIKPSGDTNPEYTLTQRGDNQVLTWNVVWQKGQNYVLTYQFNPPDKSPDFYTLGPLKIGNRFSEIKKWQLAIDVTTTIILNNTHTILTSGTTWTVPADWTDGNNTIEVIGGGGAGRTDTTGIAGAGGGGGGAYAKSVNIALTPGSTVDYQIGQGGIATSLNGTDTFFNRTSGSAGTCADTTSACAKGGTGATSATGAAGGLASSSFATGTGNVKNNGGTGGTGNTTSDSGGGGGGAGGPNGAGGTGGAGDTDNATDGVGGGGGGNGGGAAGGSGITSDTIGAAGGNGNGGTGGGTGGTAADGANGTANTGGGGGGGADNFDGGNGANGSDLVAGVNVGSGGGGGGTGDTATTTGMGGNGGLYGGGGGGGRYGGFGAPGVIIITYNGNTPTNNSWVVPSDWNSSDNSITVIGGGGAGVSAAQGTGAAGGGGGGYSSIANLSLTPSASVAYQIGVGGRKTTVGTGAGTAGNATFFNRTAGSAGTCADTVSVCANPGAAGSGTTGGAGGSTTGADGTTLFAGGAGGAGNSTGDTGGGGGGAGGTTVGRVGGAGSASTSGGGGGGGGAGGASSAVGQAGQATVGGTGGAGPDGTGGGTAGNAGHGGAGTVNKGGGGGGGDDVFGGGKGGNGSTTTYGGGGGGGAGDNNTAATSQAYGGFGGNFGGGGGGGLTNGFGGEGMIIISYTPLVTISIAGTADGNDGATVKVAINGSVQAQTTTISSSAWTISGVTEPVADDIVTVWVDGVADSLETTAVTKWSSGNITGMVLNTNTLSIGSNQDTSLSLTNLNSYDCTEDEDVMHQAAGSHLKVEGDSCAGSANNIYSSEKIDILSGDTLAVATSEILTSYDLTITGTLTSTGNSTYNVAHDWVKTGTFTSSTSTVNLNGVDSSTQTLSGSTSFYNLTGNSSSNWYNSSWTYRQKITIDHTKVGANQTDFPIYINLTDLPSSFHTHVNQTDARDIRVTKNDGTTELPREVVFYDSSTDTGELHLKYTGTLSSSYDTDLFIYYGNAGASDYAVTDTFGRNNVWTNSYAAVYHLKETGAGTVDEYKDSVGTNDGQGGAGNSGATPTTATGQVYTAGDFDGTDDFISIPDDSTLDITSQITVSSWIYSDVAQDQFDKVIAKNKATYYPFQIGFNGAADDKLYFTVSDSTSDRAAISNADIAATTWTYTTGTYDGSVVKLYVDAVAQTTTYSGSFSIETNNNTLVLGGRTSQFFNGRTDEVRISSTARSSTWITAEYNNQSSPSTFYSMNGSEATSITRTIRFTAGTTQTVTGTWTVTGSLGSTVVLESSTASAWTINPTAASVSYVSVSYSTNTGTSFCAPYSTNGGNNTSWNINAGSCNTAPNSPTSLVQKTTGDVTLATGDWLSATSVKFSATATDTDNPDTLYLCVEKDLLGVSFSNTEDSCGSGVAYSGSGVTVTHTISSQTDASEYHWQARVKDTAGTYSAWVSYDVNAESARDYGLDTTAPTGGTVYDGTSAGVDSTFSDSSLSSLSANWASVVSDVSGLSKYEYSIGTSAGGTDIKNWTDNTTSTSVTTTGLTLQSSTLYYFNVRTTDGADNVSTPISSNGQLVSPSISFSVSPNPLTFANINSANSYSDTKTTTLTTSTNAYNGYVIRAFVSDYLRSDDTLTTIPDFNPGTYASPATWAGSETGLGYTSSDTTIGGSDKFGSGTLYAPFSHSGPGDIVADHTNNVSGTPISNETFTLTYKIKTPATQVAKRYSNTVILTATAQY